MEALGWKSVRDAPSVSGQDLSHPTQALSNDTSIEFRSGGVSKWSMLRYTLFQWTDAQDS